MMAATARGWHLFNHGAGALLADWLAWPLVGGGAEGMLSEMLATLGDVVGPLAAWVAARSRLVEDWLAESGAEQYVILGAGLDSFAWRQGGGVRVFEVDHPATQAWKRSRLEALAVGVPADLVWVPVDFEVESVADGLERCGFRPRGTFVSWLGVTAYLSRDAIAATLRALPPCSLAASYAPGVRRSQGVGPTRQDVRGASKAFQKIAAEIGEPVVSLFSPSEFAELLADHGFGLVEDVGPDDVGPRYGIPAVSMGNERVSLARSDR
jgi:methyltransferase (TIGR00027 family)